MTRLRVGPLPTWMDAGRLLGPGFIQEEEGGYWSASLSAEAAADVSARLRGLGFGGQAVEVHVEPKLSRTLVRTARSEDSRRRWHTTPGFLRPGARTAPEHQEDPEARWSVTPEALSLTIGRMARRGARVVDLMCGVGGSSIGFARSGARVHALDVSPGRIAVARHNASIYGVSGQITFEHADARRRLPDLRGDLLFLDPPWGEHWDRRRVQLAELPLLADLWPMTTGFAEVWLKLPPSFDAASLPTTPMPVRCTPIFGESEGDFRRVKLLLVRIGSPGPS